MVTDTEIMNEGDKQNPKGLHSFLHSNGGGHSLTITYNTAIPAMVDMRPLTKEHPKPYFLQWNGLANTLFSVRSKSIR